MGSQAYKIDFNPLHKWESTFPNEAIDKLQNKLVATKGICNSLPRTKCHIFDINLSNIVFSLPSPFAPTTLII